MQSLIGDSGEGDIAHILSRALIKARIALQRRQQSTRAETIQRVARAVHINQRERRAIANGVTRWQINLKIGCAGDAEVTGTKHKVMSIHQRTATKATIQVKTQSRPRTDGKSLKTIDGDPIRAVAGIAKIQCRARIDGEAIRAAREVGCAVANRHCAASDGDGIRAVP